MVVLGRLEEMDMTSTVAIQMAAIAEAMTTVGNVNTKTGLILIFVVPIGFRMCWSTRRLHVPQ